MSTDLVLVNPADQRQAYQALALELTAVEPPVWAGLIAGFISGKGFSVAIVDATAEGLDAMATARRVLELDPLLVGVVVYGHHPSASTQYMPAAGAVCAALKDVAPETRVLLLGGHVAALPERTLREEAADYVCDGEGPVTVLELLETLRNGGSDLSKVRGLWYWEGDHIRTNSPAPLVVDLDREMPGIPWDLLPMERYRAHNWHCFGGLPRTPYASLYTSLGCPFKCSFCCIHAPFRTGERALGWRTGVNSYRRWSPEKVINQIDVLVNRYGVRNLKIADELFVLNADHVAGICDVLSTRGYDLNIWGYARVDTLRPGLLEKLRRAGVRWLALGIESASKTVLQNVNKAFDQETVYRAVEMVRSAGINVIGNFIFGLPDDDHESLRATLELAMDLNCEFVNFYCAMAYPGSELYRLAVQEGWPLPETWSGYAQHARDTLPLPTKHLSGPEVLRFRDEAFQAYFNNPRYLHMVAQKFGKKAVDHIRQMVSQKLERQYLTAPPTEGPGEAISR